VNISNLPEWREAGRDSTTLAEAAPNKKAPGVFRRSAQIFDDDVFSDSARRVNNKSFGKQNA
jgi:hypothetical protein